MRVLVDDAWRTGETMTQPNYQAQVDQITVLQETLHLVAQGQPFTRAVAQLVQLGQRICGAQAGFCLMFDLPRVLVVQNLDAALLPEDALLAEMTAQLAQNIHAGAALPGRLNEQYQGWLAMPIYVKGRPVALFALLHDASITLNDEAMGLLSSITDALSIVCNNERIVARHQMLTRNQNEFVRITTHDLRSPLTAMRGFASMLESIYEEDDSPLDMRHMRFVEKILSGVDQMSSLVDNIQDAGRFDPETGFYEMERAPVDLIDLVHRIVDSHLLPAEKQDLTLTVKASDDVPIINVDEMMVERATTNLVDNAIKYTPNGGRIEVSVRRDGERVVISVTDTGLGISPENLKQIFNRHVRIHRREHKLVKGSGLGLFIVRAVALRHGGDAHVESVENEGSTFSFYIPLSGDNLLIPRLPDEADDE